MTNGSGRNGKGVFGVNSETGFQKGVRRKDGGLVVTTKEDTRTYRVLLVERPWTLTLFEERPGTRLKETQV